jgi:hypothetical protein
MVAAGDQAYVDWAANDVASPIASEAELADALRANGTQLPAWLFNATTFIQPTAATYSKSQLAAYSADARSRKASGGANIAGKPYLSDPVSRNTIGSAHDYAVANPGHVTDWKLADGTFTQLNESQLAHALQEMATFVQSCFTCESANLTAITGGTVVDLAAIDAAYAAISNTFP